MPFCLINVELSNSKLHASCIGLACGTFLLSSLYGFAAGPTRVTSSNGERKVIEQVSPPWGSVGQVNVAGYRRRVECTGSLIAANVVVTAAHCVMDPINRKPFPVDEIHFLAGVRGSKRLGHSTAKCLHFPADYDFGAQSFSKDLVLITLNDGFNDVAPSDLDRTDTAGPDIALIHAAYPADRRYVLTAQFGCHLITQTESERVHGAIIRLGRLPATKRWQQVVALLAQGAPTEKVAGASAQAAEHALEHARGDPALLQSFWFLTQIPLQVGAFAGRSSVR
jgi:Trypsin